MITARQIQSEYWQAIIEQRQANLNLQQAIESYHDTPEYKAYKIWSLAEDVCIAATTRRHYYDELIQQSPLPVE